MLWIAFSYAAGIEEALEPIETRHFTLRPERYSETATAMAAWDDVWSGQVDDWEGIRSYTRSTYTPRVFEMVGLVQEAWQILAEEQDACGLSEWEEISSEDELAPEDQVGWDGQYATIQTQAIASLDPMREVLTDAGLSQVIDCKVGQDCGEEVDGWFHAEYGTQVSCYDVGQSYLCRLAHDDWDLSWELPGSKVRYVEVVEERAYDLGGFALNVYPGAVSGSVEREILVRGSIEVGVLSGWVPELAELVGALGRVDLLLRMSLFDLQLRPMCSLKPAISNLPDAPIVAGF